MIAKIILVGGVNYGLVEGELEQKCGRWSRGEERAQGQGWSCNKHVGSVLVTADGKLQDREE